MTKKQHDQTWGYILDAEKAREKEDYNRAIDLLSLAIISLLREHQPALSTSIVAPQPDEEE